jgi:non-ribosomal peptide synthetase component E (peptide arylation enzyme)
MDRSDLDHHWAAGLTFGDLPGEAARRFGDREALLFRDRRYSFRQISQEVDRCPCPTSTTADSTLVSG